MAELTRKEHREQQKQAEQAAEARDAKRVATEREFAKSGRKEAAAPKAPHRGPFDEPTFKKVNSLKKKLNWAIGIVIFLLIVVAVVLFKL